MDWWEKVIVQNCGRALVKPKNQPGGVVPGSLMVEIKHNLHCGCLGCQNQQPKREPASAAKVHSDLHNDL